MSDVVGRFRAELERVGDVEDAEGARRLGVLFEAEVMPYLNELEQRASDEAWDIVEVAALREGLLEARAVVREVIEVLGLPTDVELSAVVARARELRADLGLPADEELPRGAVRYRTSTVEDVRTALWAVGDVVGADPSGGADEVVMRVRGITGALLEVAALPEFDGLAEQALRDPVVVARVVAARVTVAGRAWDALRKIAALPGIEVAQDAVRGDPEAVLSVVRAALAELHEVREVRASLREGAAEGPDVVGVARVRELLRAADDLRELPAVGEWWARGAREQERMLVAAWLVRRARTIVDASVGGGPDGG